MFEYSKKYINNKELELFLQEVSALAEIEYSKKNGNKEKWQHALDNLAGFPKTFIEQSGDYLAVRTPADITSFEALKPWRKGPFAFEHFTLDSEWNGYIKWQRLESHFDFKGKTVLDVGSGNGYFSYQIGLKDASFVLGLEPFLLFNYQFCAIQALTHNTENVAIAPLRLEQVPSSNSFDIVLSMGVLYHHRSPIEHILSLKKMLNKGGELLLETLIAQGEEGYSLVPPDRYAKMRNVWFIPSTSTLMSWLKKCGFSDITIIDDSITTTNEQRKTQWIGENSESLEDFICGDVTIEGHPRPRRLMLKCRL